MATSQLRSTGLELVTQLMKSMGMTTPTTVAGSTDKRSIQFWQLATDAGQKLLKEHPWQFMSREHTINTVIGVSTYALPADFDGYIADASWNRTTRLPAIGALEEFEWQMLKARNLAGTTFTMLYRITNDQIEFYDTPNSVQTIVLPYQSRGWVQVMPATVPPTYADNLQNDADIVYYDPQLFKVMLKKCWYESKQFDTRKLELEYKKALAGAKSKDQTGRTLSLARGSDYPYLGVLNIPDTGYGV